MSEKIADDYGLTQLLAYLKAHAYTGGTNGTFALATDSDMDAVLTTGESTDWSDGQSVKGSIGYYNTPAWPSKGICNYVHVPGNSIIFEYMMNTRDSNIGQNGPVSQPSGACYVPYYLNAINKQIFDDEGYANHIQMRIEDNTTKKVAEIKAQYDAHQQTFNEHYASFDSSEDTTVLTGGDKEYVKAYMPYLGVAGSTESSWEYVGYTNIDISSDHRYTVYITRKYGARANGAVYNESKATQKAKEIITTNLLVSEEDCPKLKNIGYFSLLFGSFSDYVKYLYREES